MNSRKNSTSTVFSFSFKTFLPSRDWLPEKKHCKNTTNLQVIQKQYIFPVWCPITIVASHWKFPLARRETCNCAALFWNFCIFRLWKYRKDFSRFQNLSKDSIESIKVLFDYFSLPMESEIVVQTLIKCLKNLRNNLKIKRRRPQRSTKHAKWRILSTSFRLD